MRYAHIGLDRSLALALCAVFIGVAALPVNAAPAAAVPSLPPDYVAMVRRYAEGDYAGAMATFSGWTEQRFRKHLDNLNDSVVSIRKCPACPTRMAFARLPIRAALLLHADLEIQEQFSPPQSEQETQCGMGLHAVAIEHLAAILQLLDPSAGDFLKPVSYTHLTLPTKRIV